jgi:hypothetical protein
MRNRVVLIDWEDANFEHGWLSTNELQGILIPTQTLGFTVAEDSYKISVAQNKSTIDTFMGIMTIPKSCIMSIREMRVR